ncbi:SDR family NAD(P)-dependent oxidoreductase [Paenibacillus sp. CF384]|uniref:SDR family NAD(P)-dependent oxidoreductase n=1 Tax=Paenibacillus sp. CF384 TaxID=1884382 RepID=UPI0008961514|nr:SDR family NAD(P)-dependent oxidoreductase [Paenibacillus sp. CF384]SDW11282.1 3-oxoacyl-[acyl-carrier protein] reductase [Paenibacillus sp. CF384]
MRTALITGASRGIGRSIALELGRNGYQVAVNGLHEERIDAVVETIRLEGGTAEGYCANVADPSAVTAMVQAVEARYGAIHVFIHNAGHLHDRKCEQMTDLEWNSVLDVHLNGAFYCIQRVLPLMTSHGGDILLMTSTAGLMGSVGQVNYSSAKAGLLGMVWTLAAELRRNQIRINAIAPAALTDMTRPVIEYLKEKYAKRNETLPAFWQVGEADDVAQFVGLLLKQRDPDLTGEVFGVNGSQITHWHKPEPGMSVNGADAFFAAWKQREKKQ